MREAGNPFVASAQLGRFGRGDWFTADAQWMAQAIAQIVERLHPRQRFLALLFRFKMGRKYRPVTLDNLAVSDEIKTLLLRNSSQFHQQIFLNQTSRLAEIHP